MLVFGDYVFIPFTFCITSRYLCESGESNFVLSGVAGLLGVVGYAVFRMANSEKHRFKVDKVAFEKKERAVVIGGLLASGWWGMSRHINYFGDLLLSLGMCLPAAGLGLMPFFYTIYLHILLTQRAFRDHLKCQKKYR
jgi:steroid 5-alpha reductase family enzyme